MERQTYGDAQKERGRAAQHIGTEGWPPAGLRGHQGSVLGPARGRQVFAKQWFSPEDHSKEFIPL